MAEYRAEKRRRMIEEEADASTPILVKKGAPHRQRGFFSQMAMKEEKPVF